MSRRPLAPFEIQENVAIDRMVAGGRRWSESPIGRPAFRRPRAPGPPVEVPPALAEYPNWGAGVRAYLWTKPPRFSATIPNALSSRSYEDPRMPWQVYSLQDFEELGTRPSAVTAWAEDPLTVYGNTYTWQTKITHFDGYTVVSPSYSCTIYRVARPVATGVLFTTMAPVQSSLWELMKWDDVTFDNAWTEGVPPAFASGGEWGVWYHLAGSTEVNIFDGDTDVDLSPSMGGYRYENIDFGMWARWTGHDGAVHGLFTDVDGSGGIVVDWGGAGTAVVPDSGFDWGTALVNALFGGEPTFDVGVPFTGTYASTDPRPAWVNGPTADFPPLETRPDDVLPLTFPARHVTLYPPTGWDPDGWKDAVWEDDETDISRWDLGQFPAMHVYGDGMGHGFFSITFGETGYAGTSLTLWNSASAGAGWVVFNGPFEPGQTYDSPTIVNVDWSYPQQELQIEPPTLDIVAASFTVTDWGYADW